MTKAALIILERDKIDKNPSLFKRVIKKSMGFVEGLIRNEIEKVTVENENFSLYIIKIPKIVLESGRMELRLEKLFKWLKKEGITVIAFDEYFECDPILKEKIKEFNIEMTYGINVFFSIELKVLKKLLKSKGLDINETDTVIISDDSSRYEEGYIKYLASYVKYLTYVTKDINMKEIIEDLFDNSGFSIRVCSNIKDCLGEAGLVINLTKKDVIPKVDKTKNRLVVRNTESSIAINNSNITTINEIKIDISSKIKIRTKLKYKHEYMICEMYILSKLGKLYLLKQFAKEEDLKAIYQTILSEGFKINGLNGMNL